MMGQRCVFKPDPILPEPTGDQCMACELVEHDGVRYLATFYPQMGGYYGKCLVELPKDPDGCIEVCVWHDGDFPFHDDDGHNPRWIHHCDVDQFRVFAQQVAEARGLA